MESTNQIQRILDDLNGMIADLRAPAGPNTATDPIQTYGAREDKELVPEGLEHCDKRRRERKRKTTASAETESTA